MTRSASAGSSRKGGGLSARSGATHRTRPSRPPRRWRVDGMVESLPAYNEKRAVSFIRAILGRGGGGFGKRGRAARAGGGGWDKTGLVPSPPRGEGGEGGRRATPVGIPG